MSDEITPEATRVLARSGGWDYRKYLEAGAAALERCAELERALTQIVDFDDEKCEPVGTLSAWAVAYLSVCRIAKEALVRRQPGDAGED